MSAATHGLVTNPDEADIKLETSNRVISVTQFVDDVQSDPWFPKTLQCYECSLSSVSFPECGTCTNSMEELWTQRDNGWSCSGIDQPGGCLSGCSQNGMNELLAGGKYDTIHFSPATIRGNGYNTAGWKRWRCHQCDFDYCEKCTRRSLEKLGTKSVKVWRYEAASGSRDEAASGSRDDSRDDDSRDDDSSNSTLPNVVDVDLELVLAQRFPLFFLMTNHQRPNNEYYHQFLQRYLFFHSSGIPAIFHSFRKDVHLFLVVSPGIEHASLLESINILIRNGGSHYNQTFHLDIITEADYFKISNKFHNKEAIFSIGYLSNQRKRETEKETETEKENQESQSESKSKSESTSTALQHSLPRIGVHIMQLPQSLVGSFVQQWLRRDGGLHALKMLYEGWYQHIMSKEKVLLTQYGTLAGSLLVLPSSKVRQLTRLFPMTTAYPGSEMMIQSNMNHNCPLSLRINDAISLPPPRSTDAWLLRLPKEVLVVHILSSFLYPDVRDLRYLLTSCKQALAAVRDTVFNAMKLNSLTSSNKEGGRQQHEREALIEKVSSACMPNNGEETIAMCMQARQHLSSALVILGVPHRMLWRIHAHKKRGNAEFEHKKYGRALCHWLLALNNISKLSIYFNENFVTKYLTKKYAPEFDFDSAHAMDVEHHFTVTNHNSSSSSSSNTYHGGVDDVLQDWDDRMLGYCSRASSELDHCIISCLMNASLCLLKLEEPAYALQFAKYAKEPPVHVRGWRGQEQLPICFKADVRIGQALQAMQRYQEAKEVFQHGCNTFRKDIKITKIFRGLLVKLKKEEEVWRHGFSCKLQAADVDAAEREQEEKLEEERRRLAAAKYAKDDIF